MAKYNNDLLIRFTDEIFNLDEKMKQKDICNKTTTHLNCE